MFGLILAVGIVVDDAIVVVENVERNMALGMAPREAAHKTMDEVSTALIAIALTLCAVFVPAAFISGISGLFFTQFAVTIAASTIISVHRLADAEPGAVRGPAEAAHADHAQAAWRQSTAARLRSAASTRGFEWLSIELRQDDRAASSGRPPSSA